MKFVSTLSKTRNSFSALDPGPNVVTGPNAVVPSLQTGSIVTFTPAIFAARGGGVLTQSNFWTVGGVVVAASLTLEILAAWHQKQIVAVSQCKEKGGTRPGIRIEAILLGEAVDPTGGAVNFFVPGFLLVSGGIIQSNA